MSSTPRRTCVDSRTAASRAPVATAAGCAAAGGTVPSNTPPQKNVVLTNLLQQFAQGIPGLPGGPVLPPVPPPIVIWQPKNGLTVTQNGTSLKSNWSCPVFKSRR